MKIVLVHAYYQQRGGEEVVFEQERQLLEQSGHQVLTYCRSNSEIEQYSAPRKLLLIKQTIWASDSYNALKRLLRKERPDLVHVHNTLPLLSPSIYSACQEESVPVVQTLHNYRLFCPAGKFFREGVVCEECPEHGLQRSVRYACYRDSRTATAATALMLGFHRANGTWTDKIDRYIALTEFARQKFIDLGLPALKVSVKPNFVQHDPGEREGTGEHAVFVGRLSPEKGLTTLLSAWKRLSSRIPLRIIGDGPLRAHLEALAQEEGLSSVHFLGRLPRDQTFEAIKGARLLVLPSEWYEGFPMVLAESFACGVPVVCSARGAMQEIVDHERTGLHFAAGDPADLVDKVEWAWSHPMNMAAMGKEARREYEAKYSARRNYEMLMEIYRYVAPSLSVAIAAAGLRYDPVAEFQKTLS